jgi:hypothetical protein
MCGHSLSRMKGLTFQPYVPCGFDGTLVLGESTFKGVKCGVTGWGRCFDDAYPWKFICAHVKANIDEDARTFRRIRESFVPVEVATEFWKKKAFTNFIPELLSHSGARPRKDQWSAGHDQFELVLDIVQPKRILVVGARLWENLPAVTHETRRSGFFRDSILAIWLNHPSCWNRRGYTVQHANARRLTARLMSPTGHRYDG